MLNSRFFMYVLKRPNTFPIMNLNLQIYILTESRECLFKQMK